MVMKVKVNDVLPCIPIQDIFLSLTWKWDEEELF